MHPKDPYKRVDTLPSRREVRVEVGGREVARSQGGVWLFETGLPVRYYLEKTAVSGVWSLFWVLGERGGVVRGAVGTVFRLKGAIAGYELD